MTTTGNDASTDNFNPMIETKSILNRRFIDAVAYASSIHRQHIKKGSDVPCILHLSVVTQSLFLERVMFQ